MLDGRPFTLCQQWCHQCVGVSTDVWEDDSSPLQYEQGRWRPRVTVAKAEMHDHVKAVPGCL